MSEFMSIPEMMAEYGISRSTAFKWIREGEVTTYSFIGDRRTYVRREDIEKLRTQPVVAWSRTTTAYQVEVTNLITGEEIEIDGGGPGTEWQAVEFAERLAEEWFGGDDVTWFRHAGLGSYLVGRINEDGNQDPPSVEIRVVEVQVEVPDGRSPKKAAA